MQRVERLRSAPEASHKNARTGQPPEQISPGNTKYSASSEHRQLEADAVMAWLVADVNVANTLFGYARFRQQTDAISGQEGDEASEWLER
jgi:hypothetical protein